MGLHKHWKILNFLWFGFVLLPAFASPFYSAQGMGRVECRAVASRILGRDVRYCVFLPASFDASKSQRYPTLYFLHGLGANEQTLINIGAWNMVENLREEGRVGEYIIAAPDGGASFFINSQDGRQRYEDFFIREFVPMIERQYHATADRAHRGLSGMSMGGYGALRFAFRYPELFGSVSVHSAALLEHVPSVSPGVGGRSMAMATTVFGRVFGSPFDLGFWNRNSPLTLARQAQGLKQIKIYFDCGLQDDFGFDAGAKQLDEVLKARGIPHEFHLYPGRHDWTYFSAHLPDSFEFESRAFGLTTARK
jgi:S-formylglutathione hydrolase FrmB